MARSLQYGQAAQRIGLSPTGPGNNSPDGPEAHDALTIKPDHPMGARHGLLQRRLNNNVPHLAWNAVPDVLLLGGLIL